MITELPESKHVCNCDSCIHSRKFTELMLRIDDKEIVEFMENVYNGLVETSAELEMLRYWVEKHGFQTEGIEYK